MFSLRYQFRILKSLQKLNDARDDHKYLYINLQSKREDFRVKKCKFMNISYNIPIYLFADHICCKLKQMTKCKLIILIIHLLLILCFLAIYHFSHLEILLAPLLHILVLKNDSACFVGHCTHKNSDPNTIPEACLNCGIGKWIRMRHCFKCQRCIHKYDHHCVLMDICIGQFNHKYYFLFLVSYLWNNVLYLIRLTEQMREQVTINEEGVQSSTWTFYSIGVLLIVVYFNLALTCYLVFNHVYYIIFNETTWEYYKRDTIYYLKGVNREIIHPFDKGILANVVELFSANPDEPIEWSLKGK